MVCEVNDRSTFKTTVVWERRAEERGQGAAPGFWGKNKAVSARYWDAGRIRILATHLANQGVAMRVVMPHVSVKYVLIPSGRWDLCCQHHMLPGGHGLASGLRLSEDFGVLPFHFRCND